MVAKPGFPRVRARTIMTRSSTAAVYIFAFLPLLSSCDKTESQLPFDTSDQPSTQAMDIAKVKEVYSDNLNYLGEYLTERGARLSDIGTVIEGASKFYQVRFGAESDISKRMSLAFANYGRRIHALGGSGGLTSAEFPAATLSPKLRTVVEHVRAAIRESSGGDDFQQRLKEIKNDILGRGWDAETEHRALSYVIILGESMSFLAENPQLVSGPSVALSTVSSDRSLIFLADDESWWDSWGRCATGIVGGAILGGLTGAGAGSVVPAIGTTVGGVVGAIGGGLTGAAAAC